MGCLAIDECVHSPENIDSLVSPQPPSFRFTPSLRRGTGLTSSPSKRADFRHCAPSLTLLHFVLVAAVHSLTLIPKAKGYISDGGPSVLKLNFCVKFFYPNLDN